MIIMSTSEEWVKIYVDNSRPYYWNRRTQKIKNEEVQTSWAGKKDTSSGYFYFWRVNCPEQSVWQLPPLEEEAHGLYEGAIWAERYATGLKKILFVGHRTTPFGVR